MEEIIAVELTKQDDYIIELKNQLDKYKNE